MVATNTVYFDAMRPSRLVLPVTNAPALGVAIPAAAPGANDAFVVRGAWPNPFVGRVHFDLEMPRPAPIETRIYDVRGRRIRDLVDRTMPAGEYAIAWTGRDNRGLYVPSGVYFVKLETQAGTRSRKLVVAER